MGCSQSKANDQVIERVSVDNPAEEVPAPDSVKVTESEVEIEAALKSEEVAQAPASVPVEAVEETPKTEEPQTVEDEPAAHVEEVVKEPSSSSSSSSEEEETADFKTAEAAPAEEVAVKDPVEVEEKKEEAEVVQTSVVAEAPKSEALVDEAPASEVPVEEKSFKSEVVEDETPIEEPKSVAVEAPTSKAKAVDGSLTFTAEAVTFDDKGVAFYNFDGSDSINPANDVHVSKRYSEFKALHAQLTQKLSDNQVDLPSLPKSSILQGRKNKNMLEERKTQFAELLNAIAAHPVAAQSDAFKSFLA